MLGTHPYLFVNFVYLTHNDWNHLPGQKRGPPTPWYYANVIKHQRFAVANQFKEIIYKAQVLVNTNHRVQKRYKGNLLMHNRIFAMQ